MIANKILVSIIGTFLLILCLVIVFTSFWLEKRTEYLDNDDDIEEESSFQKIGNTFLDALMGVLFFCAWIKNNVFPPEEDSNRSY